MIKAPFSLFVKINSLNFSFPPWQFPQSFDLSPGSPLNQRDPIYSFFSCGCWDCEQHLRRRLGSPRLHNLSNTFWYYSAHSSCDWHSVLLLYPFHTAQGANLHLTDMMPQSFQLLFPTQCLIMFVIPEYC